MSFRSSTVIEISWCLKIFSFFENPCFYFRWQNFHLLGNDYSASTRGWPWGQGHCNQGHVSTRFWGKRYLIPGFGKVWVYINFCWVCDRLKITKNLLGENRAVSPTILGPLYGPIPNGKKCLFSKFTILNFPKLCIPKSQSIVQVSSNKFKRNSDHGQTKVFDYTAIANRLRTVSLSNYNHPNGVVNQLRTQSSHSQQQP